MPAYRYSFEPEVPLGDVQETLVLALLAGAALHGAAQLTLDVVYRLDLPGRACMIAADTAAGRDLNRLFTNFLVKEFGRGAFTVQRVALDGVTQSAAT
jgi:hypothetical protein